MSELEKDQVFVEYVIKALVDKPEKVQIKRTVEDRGVLLELTVDPEDMGKVIGKEGATAKSIRTLLRVLGAKDDERYNLKITEPEGSTHDSTTREENTDSKAVDTSDRISEIDTSKSEAIKAKAREGIEDLDTDI